MGDFNENIFNSVTTVLKVMESHGYRQSVTDGTTEAGTLIDHVYVKGVDPKSVHVLPTYYSYHEAVLAMLSG